MGFDLGKVVGRKSSDQPVRFCTLAVNHEFVIPPFSYIVGCVDKEGHHHVCSRGRR